MNKIGKISLSTIGARSTIPTALSSDSKLTQFNLNRVLAGMFMSILLATSVLAEAVAEMRPSSPALGEIKVFIITIEYPDHHHNPEAADPLDVFRNVNNYVREVSLGKAYVTYQKTASWLMMPHGWSSFYNSRIESLVDDAIRLGDPYVDYRLYHSIFIYSAGGLPSEPAYGAGPICAKHRQFRTDEGTLSLKVALNTEHRRGSSTQANLDSFSIHEFMHTLGLPDLTPTGGTCSDTLLAPYLGRWSMMAGGYGSGCGSRNYGYLDTASHLDAWSKIQLGWIGESQVLVFNPSGPTSQEVALSVTESQIGGFYAIKIPVLQGQYFLIEGRSRMGFDSTLPSEGVLITAIDESKATPVTLVDATPATTTVDDAAFPVGQRGSFGSTFQVYVESKMGSSYRLRVAYAPSSKTTTTADFGVAVSPGSISVVQGEAAASTVTISSIGTFSSPVILRGVGAPVGLNIGFRTATVTPASGASTSSVLSVAVTSSTAPGTYLITIVGTSGSMSRTAVLTIVVATALTSSTQATSPTQTALRTQTAAQPVDDVMDIVQRNSLPIIGLLALLIILIGALALKSPKKMLPPARFLWNAPSNTSQCSELVEIGGH